MTAKCACFSSYLSYLLFLLIGATVANCGSDPAPSNSGGLTAPVLEKLSPTILLPHSRLLVSGQGFRNDVNYELILEGSVMLEQEIAEEKKLKFPLVVNTDTSAQLIIDESVLLATGYGVFHGQASVMASVRDNQVTSASLEVTLTFSDYLSPQLTFAMQGDVYLNSRIELIGEDFLLGDEEGKTFAEVNGCFLPTGTMTPCESNGRKITSQKLLLKPSIAFDRQNAYFELAPSVLGITPGAFTGTVRVVNVHADGTTRSSFTRNVQWQLNKTKITVLSPTAVSLGQFLNVTGAGFVGGTGASTAISFEGTFSPKNAVARQITFEVIVAYVDGANAQYIVEENTGIGANIDFRREFGTLKGTWTPKVIWGAEKQEGTKATLSVNIAPIKQVVWLRYTQGWSDALKLFGLQAVDQKLRQRILSVLKRDYAGSNLDFRESEPTDFKLYAKLDFSGQDPNGFNLLGYDNSPGKDVGNKRLYDWIGGVNALTQQDGYPGYGGVFLESLFGFSSSPPVGYKSSDLSTQQFDQIFDPFRPDHGQPLTDSENELIPEIQNTGNCPAKDRYLQAACAVRVLGNLIGSTASHEFGHSLGLANPYGAETDFHDPGDLPNRLMDSGSARPFEERAEIGGQGPAVFCVDEYLYLKEILPLDPPIESTVNRPSCQ